MYENYHLFDTILLVYTYIGLICVCAVDVT